MTWSVSWSFRSQCDHVWHLTLTVAVTWHDHKVIQCIRLQSKHPVVNTAIQRDALPDLVYCSLTVEKVMLNTSGMRWTGEWAWTVQLNGVRVRPTLALNNHWNWHTQYMAAYNNTMWDVYQDVSTWPKQATAFSDQQSTGLASFRVHTTHMATTVSKLLVRGYRTTCRCIYDEILAMDNSSSNWKNFCLCANWQQCIVSDCFFLFLCPFEIFLLPCLLIALCLGHKHETSQNVICNTCRSKKAQKTRS